MAARHPAATGASPRRRRTGASELDGDPEGGPSVALGIQPDADRCADAQVRALGTTAGRRSGRPGQNLFCFDEVDDRLVDRGRPGGEAVTVTIWGRFSPPLFRSSNSVFAAAPPWNLSLLPATSGDRPAATASRSASAFIPRPAPLGVALTRFGRSSTRWYWSSRQPWSNGIAKASGSIGGGDHTVPDDPRSAQKSVI